MTYDPQAANPAVRQFTVGHDDADIRLDRWFKRHLPQIGFATISRWARTGQIRVDGKRAAPEDRLSPGQIVRVPPGEGIAAATRGGPARKPLTEAQIESAHAMVIHRDPAAIVLNKTPGLATQGGSGTFEHVDGLLDAFVDDSGSKSGPRPRLVHRLDKDTSGVLLIAATPGSAAYFSKRFSGRSARKVYWAIIAGVPSVEDGIVDLPLAKQPGSGGEKMMVDRTEHGAPARTRYRVIDRAGNRAAWVELMPYTGRTHQLRVHMAAIGHPIVGDGKYGGIEAFLTGSISRKLHLHARRLVIDHPDGTPLDVTARLPPHFAASLESLGFAEHDGDALGDDLTAPRETFGKDDAKAAARAHAKQVRKERRGERTRRRAGDAAAPRARAPGPGASKPGASKAAGRATSASAARATAAAAARTPPRAAKPAGSADRRPGDDAPARQSPSGQRTARHPAATPRDGAAPRAPARDGNPRPARDAKPAPRGKSAPPRGAGQPAARPAPGRGGRPAAPGKPPRRPR